MPFDKQFLLLLIQFPLMEHFLLEFEFFKNMCFAFYLIFNFYIHLCVNSFVLLKLLKSVLQFYKFWEIFLSKNINK